MNLGRWINLISFLSLLLTGDLVDYQTSGYSHVGCGFLSGYLRRVDTPGYMSIQEHNTL